MIKYFDFLIISNYRRGYIFIKFATVSPMFQIQSSIKGNKCINLTEKISKIEYLPKHLDKHKNV